MSTVTLLFCGHVSVNELLGSGRFIKIRLNGEHNEQEEQKNIETLCTLG